jgi:hypothetical protein
MKSNILVDGKELKLNHFIQDLSANLIDGIAKSLKFSEGKRIEFVLKNDEVKMSVDAQEIPLDLGHASQIVRAVLKGFLSNLHGIEDTSEVRMVCER